MLLEIRKTDAFEVWLRGLRDQRGKAKIVARIDRLALGNPGDVAPVGEGVSELRIHFGPGYRIYFVRPKRRSWSCCVAETKAAKKET